MGLGERLLFDFLYKKVLMSDRLKTLLPYLMGFPDFLSRVECRSALVINETIIMSDAKCRICRRVGEKLFLKGERCYTPKCAIIRKPYPPGVHGPKRKERFRKSEYGTQLKEKQKVRYLYGISERQFENYVYKSLKNPSKDVAATLAALLESRLDNVVFRLGFALSRSVAHQMISHGHIVVNGGVVTIPSYKVHIGDLITLNKKLSDSGTVKHLDITLKKHEVPPWLDLDREKKIGKVISTPLLDEFITLYNMKSIIEFYSR